MNFWETALELDRSGVPFAVVTQVSCRGHAPQEPGAKAIITADGLRCGTVGGGKVEARAIAMVQEKLAALPPHGVLTPELHTWNLQRDIGMSCGGEASFLFEYHLRAAWKIVIFGAGHVAQALVQTLLSLECQIVCIDPRQEWIDKLPLSPRLTRLCVSDPRTLIESQDCPDFIGPRSFFVIMTQGHATDLPILNALLRKVPEATYIGSIGSEVKAIKMRNELRDLGISDEVLARLHLPIGLLLGGNHPAEIAISIAAQLLQVRDSSREA